jgi:hypothetical protein
MERDWVFDDFGQAILKLQLLYNIFSCEIIAILFFLFVILGIKPGSHAY